MTSPMIAICQRMITLMIADATNFSTVNGWHIGEVPIIALQRLDACEVTITDERVSVGSTSVNERILSGFIRFTCVLQDIPTYDVNNVYIASSYVRVYEYAQAVIRLFNKQSNRNLNALTITNGQVQRIAIASPAQYGIGERSSSYDYQALMRLERQSLLQFEVTIIESKDFS